MAGSSGNPNQPLRGKSNKPPVRRHGANVPPQVATPPSAGAAPAHPVPPVVGSGAGHTVRPVAGPQADAGPGVGIQISDAGAGSPSHTYTRPHGRKSSLWTNPAVVIGAGFAGVCLVFLVIVLSSSRGASELKIKPISPQVVDELARLELTIATEPAGTADEPLEFSLTKAPEGAKIDAKTGRVRWTPTELQGPGTHDFTVRVVRADSPEDYAQRKFVVEVDEVNQPPVVEPVEDQWIEPGRPLELTVEGHDPDQPASRVEYRLVEGRETGAQIDPRSGRFEWTPRSMSPGTSVRFVIEVAEATRGGKQTRVEFSAGLKATVGPMDNLVADLRSRGARVETLEGEPRSPLPGTGRSLSLNGETVAVYEYNSGTEAKEYVAEVPAEVMERFGRTADGQPKARIFQGGPLVAFYAGESDVVREYLGVCVGEPVTLAAADPADESPFEVIQEPPMPGPDGPPPTEPPTTPEKDPVLAAKVGDEQLLAIFEDGKLCVRNQYPALRKIFADRFAAEQGHFVEQAFGDDKEMAAWLEEHAEIKEELYTAIDPVNDNVLRALQLFRELKTKFPDKIVPFAELAIAVAVTWDNERAVYDFDHHGRRTRSKLPAEKLAALENFDYLTSADRVTQAYAQFLPWEFLVHVVNHRTPLAERKWAVANYSNRRLMFGQCYKDVPYDTEMLNTEGKTCKLEGKDYTLANIKQFGGVCAHQADFASRVGKSMGIPAAYVGGEAAGGELHAWVMWVELKGVPTKTSIPFSLESFGRYRGDKYYVGTLRNPQTGQQMTDRDLELRLHTVGMSKEAKRQADLVMAAYTMLRDKTEMDVTDQLVFLNKVIELSPGNEMAWIAISQMSRNGVVTKKHNPAMQGTLKRLFTTFALFPDFTWKIFDDLVSYMDVPKQRNKFYNELVSLYVKAGRPDLACLAVLKYTDHLVAEEEYKNAIGALTMTIMAFPDEGRYVPALLDKLEAVCMNVDGSQPQLLNFYRQFLPRVPKARGDRISPYWVSMCQRAADRFRQAGDEAGAKAIEAELAKVQKK